MDFPCADMQLQDNTFQPYDDDFNTEINITNDDLTFDFFSDSLSADDSERPLSTTNPVLTSLPDLFPPTLIQPDLSTTSFQKTKKRSKEQKIRPTIGLFISNLLRSQYQNRKRGPQRPFSPEQKRTFDEWYLQHLSSPFLDDTDVEQLSNATGLTSKQIRIYFVNKRSREKKKPMNRPQKAPGLPPFTARPTT
jgi:hypothetical protein